MKFSFLLIVPKGTKNGEKKQYIPMGRMIENCIRHHQNPDTTRLYRLLNINNYFTSGIKYFAQMNNISGFVV